MNWKPIRKLLLIDNDEINNFIVEELFQEAEVAETLDICTGCTEALTYLEENEDDFPDLILLDLNMPVFSGFDFLDRYAEKGYDKKSTRIVVLSSSLNAKDKEASEAYPTVSAFFVKPLEINNLKKLALEEKIVVV